MVRKERWMMVLGMTACAFHFASSAMTAPFQETQPAPHYVGAETCKACHRVEFAQWSRTNHAKAFESLKPEDRTKDACVSCHVTGFGKEAAAGAELQGVQCEACHGPGSLYKDPLKIMNMDRWYDDPEGQKVLAREAGLMMPTRDTCVACHRADLPKAKVFDYDAALRLVRHRPAAPAEPAASPDAQ